MINKLRENVLMTIDGYFWHSMFDNKRNIIMIRPYEYTNNGIDIEYTQFSDFTPSYL